MTRIHETAELKEAFYVSSSCVGLWVSSVAGGCAPWPMRESGSPPSTQLPTGHTRPTGKGGRLVILPCADRRGPASCGSVSGACTKISHRPETGMSCIVPARGRFQLVR